VTRAEHDPPRTPAESADAALPRLVEQHGPRLFTLASRFCGDRDQAEDLVQEVFMRAYTGWEGFRGEASEGLERAITELPEGTAPPPAYPEQTCLDLLSAKQSALDRGVPFEDRVICERCRSVFDSLNLAGDLCREISEQSLPPGLRERIVSRPRAGKPSTA